MAHTLDSSPRRCVLMTGLQWTPPPGSSPIRNQPATAAELKQKIQQQTKKMEDAGIELHHKLLDPSDFDTGIQSFKTMLLERRYDAIMFGFGIRGVPEFTPQFEQMINASRQMRPEARIGFNSRPDDTFDSVMRVLK